MSAIARSFREIGRKATCSFLSPSASFWFNNVNVNVNVLSLSRRLRSTLGRSFVLVQDGMEITELPWVVKRLSASEFFFNGRFVIENAPYSANYVRVHDDSEAEFARLLQECRSVKEVIQLLEVPGETVTSRSAAYALCRIFMLKSGSTEQIDSFIKKAILNELCDTVIKDIKALPNQIVVALTKCSLKPNSYGQDFVENVIEEVECRVGVSAFQITDLCELISSLSEHVGEFEDTLQICWVHLGSRFLDVDEKNIGAVYQVLQYVTPEFRYLLRVVDKQLHNCWSKLTSADVSAISKYLCLLNFYSGRTFSSFGKWMYANVHTVNDKQMTDILGMYMHFNYIDSNFLTSLEKFIKAFASKTVRGTNKAMDRVIPLMAAEYCRQKRIISPTILNSVATDFSLSAGAYYDVREGVSVLRTFGQLNFFPKDSSKFFSIAETWLESKLSQISTCDLLELLASFVYIGKFPVNFAYRVLDGHFPLLKEVSDPVLRHQAFKHLLEIQASYLLEFPFKQFIAVLQKSDFDNSLTWLEGRAFRFHKEVASFLKDLFGPDSYTQLQIPRYTPHLINFEISTDINKNPLKEVNSSSRTKLAIILVMPENFSSNGNFMGDIMMKKRHLQRLDYVTILVNYETFTWKCKSVEDKMTYLKLLLSPHINLKTSA